MTDLTNKRYGRLTALEPMGFANNGDVLWSCRCDCGRSVIVRGSAMTTGHTRSCGCLRREMRIQNNLARVGTHYNKTRISE